MLWRSAIKAYVVAASDVRALGHLPPAVASVKIDGFRARETAQQRVPVVQRPSSIGAQLDDHER
jgi:hypothetical protein